MILVAIVLGTVLFGIASPAEGAGGRVAGAVVIVVCELGALARESENSHESMSFHLTCP